MENELARGNVSRILFEDGAGVDVLESRTKELRFVVDPVWIVRVLSNTKESESLKKVLSGEIVADNIGKIALLGWSRCPRRFAFLRMSGCLRRFDNLSDPRD